MKRAPSQLETGDRRTKEADVVRAKAVRCNGAFYGEIRVEGKWSCAECGSVSGSMPPLDGMLVFDECMAEAWRGSCCGGGVARGPLGSLNIWEVYEGKF